MTLKDNASIKKNPITTVIGLILILISIGLFVAPYFFELKQVVESLEIAVIGGVGLLLVLAPDKLVSIIQKKAE